jgi:type II secretory pathway predicted ATPase ExeA
VTVYESFYGLHVKPFAVVPQTGFLYLSRQHRMALSLLRYGLVSNGLISVVTGEIGTGKTTVARYLLRYLKGDVTVGLVTNTRSSFGELMQWILLAFNLPYEGKDAVALFQTFEQYLRDEHARRRRVVLIVDEAQNLSVDALDGLRMLSNVNADGFLALHLLVIGQPQLREVLRRPELAQFAQRVTVDFHLEPLDLGETIAYVDHRLEVAGRGAPVSLFEPRAIELIHAESGGVPRLVNLLCDKALVYAFAAERPVVDAETVEEMLRDKRAQGGWLFQQAPAELPRAGTM